MILTAFQLFVRRELFSRRTFWLTLACLLPAAVAGIARLAGRGGYTFFESTAASIFLSILAVLVPVFHAVAAFHEEFEQRTIVYLLTRPPSRAAYVVAKYLAAWLSSAASLVIGIAATAVVCAAGGNVGLGHWIEIGGQLAVACVLASGVYSAFFLLFGLWVKNPVLIGLVVTFGWENLVRILPGSLRYWTIGIYSQSFFIHWADAAPGVFGYEANGAPPPSPLGPVGGLPAMARPQPPELTLPTLWTSLGMMALITLAALGLSISLFRRREDA